MLVVIGATGVEGQELPLEIEPSCYVPTYQCISDDISSGKPFVLLRSDACTWCTSRYVLLQIARLFSMGANQTFVSLRYVSVFVP